MAERSFRSVGDKLHKPNGKRIRYRPQRGDWMKRQGACLHVIR